MYKLSIGILIFVFSGFIHAENIALAKKDYIALIVGNYVHGFKEFETSVKSSENMRLDQLNEPLHRISRE